MGGHCPTCLGHHTSSAGGESHSRPLCANCWRATWTHQATQWAGHRLLRSSNDRSLGRNTESYNFSALVMAQGAAPLIWKTPAMTPCLNVGRAVGYLSTQSALIVPVNMRLLAFTSCHCVLMSATSRSIQDGWAAR